MYTKVILVGRITKDLEIKISQSGLSTLNFSVACDRVSRGNKETDFFNCIAFDKNAENMAKYCKKGSLILVEGTLQTRSYENQQGFKVNVVEVVSNSTKFLETKQSSEAEVSTYNQSKQTETNKSGSSYQELSKIISSENDDDPFN